MKPNDSQIISRRRWIGRAGLVLLSHRRLLAGDPSVVPAMLKEAAAARISVQPLRRGLSVLEGSGGNIGVLTGRDGKLLVDSGFTLSQAAISQALGSIDSHPIKQLINTHWHTDHTDGNEWMHAAGASIIAQANTRKHLSVETRVEGWNYTFPAAPAAALPTEVFATERSFHVNGTRIVLHLYPPAHTDCDISVHFTDADVLHVGDTWWNGIYPFIDYSTGGSIEGTIRAAEMNLVAVTEKTIVIPGHGPVGGKSDLAEFRDMLVAIREKVAALKKQGRSLDEVLAAKPTAAYDPKWGQSLTTPAAFTRLVYMGV